MKAALRGFASDNRAPAHPKIMEALASANQGHSPSYEQDDWSERAKKVLRGHFGAQAEPYFVFNGTAANVLAVRSVCDSWQAALCSDVSHLWNDEAGAPERLAGCKLIPLKSSDGKIALDTLKALPDRKGDPHASQPRLLSLTQPTELGTVYAVAELRELCAWAHWAGLLVHVDGTRLVNAAASLDAGLAELTTEAGVDLLSLGGTKNGLMMGEAVVFLKPGLAASFPWLRKQNLQLGSKTRFIAAQFEAWLGTDLWLELARHSNAMAARLAAGLRGISAVSISRPVQTNAVFAKLPAAWIAPLRKTAPFYIVDESAREARLMTAWDTQPEDVDTFLQAFRKLANA